MVFAAVHLDEDSGADDVQIDPSDPWQSYLLHDPVTQGSEPLTHNRLESGVASGAGSRKQEA